MIQTSHRRKNGFCRLIRQPEPDGRSIAIRTEPIPVRKQRTSETREGRSDPSVFAIPATQNKCRLNIKKSTQLLIVIEVKSL